MDNISFSVFGGEVHGLVGENGAGKSTLMAIASGAIAPDDGVVTIDGVLAQGDPQLARRLGLSIVRQEPALMPDLTVAENLLLGVTPDRVRPDVSLSSWTTELLESWRTDLKIAPNDRVAELNSEQRFIVEILRALAAEPKVLVLDEPTEHLGPDDVSRLFARIRSLTAAGCAVIYISHRIHEVLSIADRVTVLRDGQSQGTHDAHKLTEQQIVEAIVGRELNREFPRKASHLEHSEIALQVYGYHGKGFTNIGMAVRRGEIVGLAGIDGNGQREFIRALAGLSRAGGSVFINGRPVDTALFGCAAKIGIRYVPGDRHRDGIFGELSVRENVSIRRLSDVSIGRLLVSNGLDTNLARRAVDDFSVKTPSIETPIRLLSGGNQQKVVLSSVLGSSPAVVLIDEPTQGVDVGARMEIYKTLRATAADGIPMIVVSSDAAEIAGLCDRVLIFSRGHIVRELNGEDVTEHNITSSMLTSTSIRHHAKVGASELWKWAAGNWAPIAILCTVIALLGTYAAINNPFYLSERNMIGMLSLVATLSFVAFGQQLLMLVGGIDLSVGPLMGLMLVIQSFYLVDGASMEHQILGWLISFVVAAGVGLTNWLLVVPMRLHPMVATLATFMILQASALILRPVAGGLISEGVTELIMTTWGAVPIGIALAAAMAVGLEISLFRSRWGVSLRGFGSRPEAARLAGVQPGKTLLFAYIGCSIFAAIAAIPMLAQVGSGDPTAGVGYTLASIAAVVIGGASLSGGRGSFLGALLGALLITQVNVVTTFLNLDDAWQSYLLGMMILASVALYSKSRQMAVAV
nr:ATP-binding cassette domain-containing protein [Bradyrhizobium tropiciagri]